MSHLLKLLRRDSGGVGRGQSGAGDVRRPIGGMAVEPARFAGRWMAGAGPVRAWAGRRRGNAELFPFPAVDASVARMGKRRAFRDHATLVAGAVVMALPLVLVAGALRLWRRSTPWRT